MVYLKSVENVITLGKLTMEAELERRTILKNDAANLCLSFKLDVLTT